MIADAAHCPPHAVQPFLASVMATVRFQSFVRYEPDAMQFGDDEQPLDTSTGLYSALGGEDVSGLEYTGNQETVVAVQGPAVIANYGRANDSTWQSQPTTVGYVRGNQTSGSGTSEADFNSGTPDSNPAEELENVINFDGGGAQNTSADQPAPTSRAQQNAGSTGNGSDSSSTSDTTDSHMATEGIMLQGGGGGSSGGTLVSGGQGGYFGQLPQFLSGNATPVGPGLGDLPNYGRFASGTGVAGQLGRGPNGGKVYGFGVNGMPLGSGGPIGQSSSGPKGPGKYSTWNTPQAPPPPANPGNQGSPPTASPGQSPLNGGVPAQGSQTPPPGPGQPAPTGGSPPTPAQGNAGLTQTSPGQAQAGSPEMAAIAAYIGSGENPPSTSSSSVAIYSVGTPTIRCMACHSGYAAGLIKYSDLTPSAKNAIFMAGAQPSVAGHLGSASESMAVAAPNTGLRIAEAGEAVNIGRGDAIQHFTDLKGASGITGASEETLAGLQPGQRLVVDSATFKPGTNPFLTGEGGGVGVTKLGADAMAGELEGIGVFGEKQQYVIEFSRETLLDNGIPLRPDMPGRSIFSIPGNSTVNGTITIQKR